MKPQSQSVLEFWFGVGEERRPEWFGKDGAFDASIQDRFAELVEQALAGGLRDWDATPQGTLARVLVLDQFTRNIFRGKPRSFEGDALALEAARSIVARGDDLRLTPLQRVFVCLPYEHAEDRAAQQESLRLFAALGDPDFLDYARRHAAIVEHFGRFPHRNAILGRASTPDEIEFLKQPGSGF